LPVQAPDQAVPLLPVAAVAVSVTLVPCTCSSEQSVPQLMPSGLLVTKPLPLLVTVRAYRLTVNCASTARAELIVTVHPPVPVHAPLSHPMGVGVLFPFGARRRFRRRTTRVHARCAQRSLRCSSDAAVRRFRQGVVRLLTCRPTGAAATSTRLPHVPHCHRLRTSSRRRVNRPAGSQDS
jgi:hypothetical protein